jgi:hypothetical protein
MKTIAKEEGNVITAFNNWIGLYLSQELKQERAE